MKERIKARFAQLQHVLDEYKKHRGMLNQDESTRPGEGFSENNDKKNTTENLLDDATITEMPIQEHSYDNSYK